MRGQNGATGQDLRRSPRREAARRAEQLLVLSLAIICAAVGFALHVLWIVSIVPMAFLWGYMASELGSARRGGGVVSDVVTTIADEARGLTNEVSKSGSHPEDRSGGAAYAGGVATPRVQEPEATRRELYEEAREAGIAGRSNMTKEELQQALGGEDA